MSYILEALKKAEAERNGSAPRTLHTPPSFARTGKPRSGARNSRLWITLAATTCALIGVVWFGMLRNRPEPVAAVPLPPAAPPSVVSAPPAPVVAMAPPVIAVPEPKPAVPDKLEEKSQPKAKGDGVKKAVERKELSTQAKEEPKPTPAAPVEPPVAILRELPEQIQREIPAMTIGGYIYSGNKADRSVLINNRLMRDGDEITPGLHLEKMMPNGMVLNYKGYRYRTSY
jgi:general secretion pathway protein B